jgi:hypothetical protein
MPKINDIDAAWICASTPALPRASISARPVTHARETTHTS